MCATVVFWLTLSVAVIFSCAYSLSVGCFRRLGPSFATHVPYLASRERISSCDQSQRQAVRAPFVTEKLIEAFKLSGGLGEQVYPEVAARNSGEAD